MDYKFIEKYSEIEDILKGELILVIAKTHTCLACKTIASMLEKNVVGLEKVNLYNIFVDDIEKFRGDHLIFSAPTVLIFSEGKELLRESRYINYAKISRLIDIYTS
ncbi:MAG: thioredoxin family protein [Candidatus Izemoplasma sp.]